MADNDQHVYHHNPPPMVKIKIEKNSRGHNWEVTAEADTVDAALALIADANRKLEKAYGREEIQP